MTGIQKLHKSIRSEIELSSSEFEIISEYFKPIHVNKKKVITIQGKLNDKLYFIESGLLFLYKILESGYFKVIQFAKENYWICDLYSFFLVAQSLFSIQAIEDSKLWSFYKTDFDKLRSKFPNMETVLRLNFITPM